jgi:Flp pilus assembly protein TadD
VLKRRTSSLILSLALAFAFLAPQAALGSRVLYASGAGVGATGTPSPEPGAAADDGDADDAGDAQQPKRKGNGFARALAAPFRALARLFGGGKKSKSDEAGKSTTLPAQGAGTTAETQGAAPDGKTRNNVATQEAKASVVGAASQATTNDETAATNGEAAAQPAPVEAGIEPSRSGVSGARASEGVRIVRPAAGEVAEELRPKMWIPLIAGIPSDPVSQGRALLQHGYLQEAIAELQTAATTVGPDLAEANNLLGLAYDRLGWHQQAAAAYERALTVTPKDANVIANLGYSLYLASDYDGALKRLKQASRLAPGEPVIYNNLGVVEARLRRYDDAFKYFAKASGEYEAHLKLADIFETEKRDRDAIKHYEVALHMQPGASAVLERLVALYERTGARDKADTARRTLDRPRNPQKTATGGGG